MSTFKIVRMYANGHETEVVKRGLSLEAAQAHCRNPETSSSKAKGTAAKRRTAIYGPWFDGYEEENATRR